MLDDPKTLLGVDAIIVDRQEYTALIERRNRLQRVNDELNKDVTELKKELIEAKSKSGQGIDFDNLKKVMLPNVEKLITYLEDSVPIPDRLVKEWSDVKKYIESLK